MNVDDWQQFWSIPGPRSIVPMPQGVDSPTQLIIETPQGSYILRSYRDDQTPEQIGYKLGVLKNLQWKNLPFQIPTPIPRFII